ncbi:bifunctional adenosylcobinamide kinase/adenosylcobinamide-phosphate guanylyltransferase [Polymorphum gilvum]|uniref:Bifunctional adenosylcobalamin biosynthesis protein n=1 Tax=Polymorphum gilvum (strain LMG 25793 / CGMCC 1.9160 / SL003B-26A1) TaxID=991905 RepID=F2IXD7_POLGS|nr:bifunctional adenosylcobinamide kinase/adenosylcobinamide-phosphate guanylyltransferase [Polymorphum gilvum]ADZ70455.1 Cobinamide kinase / cobinamide phosphate guanyltransferase superfamily [Polymorphum gilvum SL003B-26A1]
MPSGAGAAAPAVLVTGGARSGKSRFAEDLVLASGLAPVYLATGAAGDGEMGERIADHRARRGPGWTTVEEGLELAATLAAEARPQCAVLVDCLTLWLSNLMLAGRDVPAEVAALCALVPRLAGPVVFVTNEVGLGIVPDNALARAFRDAQGRLNQDLARVCGRVVLVACGLPVLLKPTPAADMRL